MAIEAFPAPTSMSSGKPTVPFSEAELKVVVDANGVLKEVLVKELLVAVIEVAFSPPATTSARVVLMIVDRVGAAAADGGRVVCGNKVVSAAGGLLVSAVVVVVMGT